MKGIASSLNDGVPVPLGYYRMTMRVPAPMEGEPVITHPAASPTLSGGQGEPPRRGKGVQPRVSTLGAGGEVPSAPSHTPYLVWWTAGDDRVRQRPLHNHAVMHGKVFAIDHPIWKTWWPPAGHNCRCFIGTITAAEARDLGYTGPEPTGPWPTAPDTGLPALPDPGFEGGGDHLGNQVSPSPGGGGAMGEGARG